MSVPSLPVGSRGAPTGALPHTPGSRQPRHANTPAPAADGLAELAETVDLVISALGHLVDEDEDLRARADSWNRQLGEARRELVRLQIEHTALRNRFDEVAGRPGAGAGAAPGGAAE